MEASKQIELIKKIHSAENLLVLAKKEFNKNHKEKIANLRRLKLALLDEIETDQATMFDDEWQLTPELNELVENPISP